MSQIKELANAGFYYSGRGDETLCYHCGGKLINWKPQDNPWVEHAKWYDKCLYLLSFKGTEFVSKIRKYIEIENIPTTIDKLDKNFEKADNKNITSESSQTSINSEKSNDNNTEASTVSDEDSSKDQSVQELSDTSYKNSKLCKICFSRKLQALFIPCGHLVTCKECAKNIKICGICHKKIKFTLPVII